MPPAPKTDEDKQKLIQQFRTKSSKYVMDQYWNSDVYILKWLEFKNWSVERAEKALRKALEWRLKHNIEGVLSEDFDDLQQNFIYYMDGVDNENRPVITLPCNECYLREEIDTGNKERIKRFIYFAMETAIEKIRTMYLSNESTASTFVLILDAAGLEVRDTPPKVITTCLEAARMVEDNYPGMIEICYVVNGSKAVKTMFNMYKPMLKNKSVELLHVYGEKREKWLPKIHRTINPDQLRERFGGTRPDEIYEKRIMADGTEATFEKTVERLKEFEKDKKAVKELKKEFKEMKTEFKDAHKEKV